MKRYVIFTATLIAAFVSTGCSKVEEIFTCLHTHEVIFEASFADQTKTSYEGNGKVDWVEGDIVRYYSQKDGTIGEAEVARSGHYAKLGMTIYDDATYVIAAYGGESISNNNVTSFVLKGALKAQQSGKFEDAHISVAKTFEPEDCSSLIFQNISSIIKFELNRNDIGYVKFIANGEEPLHGYGSLIITFNDDQPSAAFEDGKGNNTISVVTEGAGVYYLGTLPAVLSKGFTMAFFDSVGNIIGTREFNDTVTIERNQVLNLGVINSIDMPETKTLTIGELQNYYYVYSPFMLSGWISMPSESIHGFTLYDETGSISVMDIVNYSEYANTLKQGDTVEIKHYTTFGQIDHNRIYNSEIVAYKPMIIPEPVIENIQNIIAIADTKTPYILTGKISNIANTTYQGFDLTDETGTIAIAFPTNFADYVDQLEEDGIVSVKGYYQFNSPKGTHQIQNGEILSYTKPTPIDPSAIPALSVKEFIDKADAATNYKLTGTVTNFDSVYCSFDLKDETGTINIYSVTNDSKTLFGNQIANGGKVTLYGKYFWYASGKKAEIKNATILTYEAGVVETSTIEGLVMAVSSKSFVVKVGDSFQYVFADAAPGVNVGDMVRVSGEKSTYNNLPQITNPQTTIKSSGNAVTYPSPSVLKGTEVDSYTTGFGYVTVTGILSKSGDYYNIEIPDSKRTGSIAYAAADYSSLVGKTIDATGFFAGISGGSYFNIITTEVKESGSQIDISLKHPLTSGCTWTLGNKANDNTSTGNNKQSGTFNGTPVDNFVKLGTGSAGGDFTINVPAGKSKVSFYCIGFSKDQSDNFPNTSGKTYSFTATVGSDTKGNVTVKRFIASGNPPFTINLKEDEDFYTIDLGTATTADTRLKITATGRMLFIGINAE